jgi:hypothetical protein
MFIALESLPFVATWSSSFKTTYEVTVLLDAIFEYFVAEQTDHQQKKKVQLLKLWWKYHKPSVDYVVDIIHSGWCTEGSATGCAGRFRSAQFSSEACIFIIISEARF